MRIRFSITSIVLVLGALLLPVSGQCGQKVVVAFSEYPPYKIITQGKRTGIDIEILTEIAKRMDLELTFKNCTFKECLAMMERGEADLMTSLLRRIDREKYILYVQPRYRPKSNKVFYVRKGSSTLIRTYDDLENLKIGVKAGVRYAPIFDRDKSLKKIPAPDVKTNFQRLLAGEIDTFVTSKTEGDYYIKTLGYQDKIVKAPLGFTLSDSSYMGISRKSSFEKQAKEFGRNLKRLLDKGQVQKIVDSYVK